MMMTASDTKISSLFASKKSSIKEKELQNVYNVEIMSYEMFIKKPKFRGLEDGVNVNELE